jgi:hypothetical protein
MTSCGQAHADFPKNWPPCYPLVRNYISEEIPTRHRRTVRMAFILYLSE